MTVATRIDWDQWRADYDQMTFKQHQAFNAEVAEQHPVQKQYNAAAVRLFLEHRKPTTVVELGGWCGSLAADTLPDFPEIRSWVNYDITPNVPQVCDDARYSKVTLIDWPWNCRIQADALIASHVLEHMRMDEVEKLLDAWDVKSVYADVPLRGNWDGYEGSHINEADTDEFLARVLDHGFSGLWEPTDVGILAWFDKT